MPGRVSIRVMSRSNPTTRERTCPGSAGQAGGPRLPALGQADGVGAWARVPPTARRVLDEQGPVVHERLAQLGLGVVGRPTS